MVNANPPNTNDAASKPKATTPTVGMLAPAVGGAEKRAIPPKKLLRPPVLLSSIWIFKLY